MQPYQAPLRDMRFVLHELHRDDGFGPLPRHAEFTPELLDAVLEEAARLTQEVLLPLNRDGDEEGCRIENGVVRTEAYAADEAAVPMLQGLGQALGTLKRATRTIAERAPADPEEGAAAATDYLRLLGLVALGYCFAKSAALAKEALANGGPDAAFYTAKRATAAFFFDRILPQTAALLMAIESGKGSTMVLDEFLF